MRNLLKAEELQQFPLTPTHNIRYHGKHLPENALLLIYNTTRNDKV